MTYHPRLSSLTNIARCICASVLLEILFVGSFMLFSLFVHDQKQSVKDGKQAANDNNE
jgi:hypothetical protein